MYQFLQSDLFVLELVNMQFMCFEVGGSNVCASWIGDFAHRCDIKAIQPLIKSALHVNPLLNGVMKLRYNCVVMYSIFFQVTYFLLFDVINNLKQKCVSSSLWELCSTKQNVNFNLALYKSSNGWNGLDFLILLIPMVYHSCIHIQVSWENYKAWLKFCCHVHVERLHYKKVFEIDEIISSP